MSRRQSWRLGYEMIGDLGLFPRSHQLRGCDQTDWKSAFSIAEQQISHFTFLSPLPMMVSTYASETTIALTRVVVLHGPACTTISPTHLTSEYETPSCARIMWITHTRGSPPWRLGSNVGRVDSPFVLPVCDRPTARFRFPFLKPGHSDSRVLATANPNRG